MFMNAHLFIYTHVRIHSCHLCILDLCSCLHSHINMQTHNHDHKYSYTHIHIHIWTNSHWCKDSQKSPQIIFMHTFAYVCKPLRSTQIYNMNMHMGEGRRLDCVHNPTSRIHPPPPPQQKQGLYGDLTYQVWQGDITWSPGKYSFPFQLHGHSSGRKHASPCLSRL